MSLFKKIKTSPEKYPFKCLLARLAGRDWTRYLELLIGLLAAEAGPVICGKASNCIREFYSPIWKARLVCRLINAEWLCNLFKLACHLKPAIGNFFFANILKWLTCSHSFIYLCLSVCLFLFPSVKRPYLPSAFWQRHRSKQKLFLLKWCLATEKDKKSEEAVGDKLYTFLVIILCYHKKHRLTETLYDSTHI